MGHFGQVGEKPGPNRVNLFTKDFKKYNKGNFIYFCSFQYMVSFQ